MMGMGTEIADRRVPTPGCSSTWEGEFGGGDICAIGVGREWVILQDSCSAFARNTALLRNFVVGE